VVIPSYNGIKLLAENLPYINESLKRIDKSEIIVVDDHSDDQTMEYLDQHFPEVRVIRNAENLGFTRSVNRGIYLAKYDLVFLLNNDVKPEGDYLSSSMEYFEKKDTFGVMGFMKDEVSNMILEGVKYPVTRVSGLKYKDIRDRKIEDCKDQIYTFYLCGGNAVIDKKKLQELNGLAEIYEPFYQEDVDLSVRAWLSGWKLYFNNKAVCYHKHSATINKYFEPAYIKAISKRNRLIISYLYLTGYKWEIFNFVTTIKSLYYKILYVLKINSVFPGYKDFFMKKVELNNLRKGPYKMKDLNRMILPIQNNIKMNLKKSGINI
jgi:GT2 family glycosyltransferase